MPEDVNVPEEEEVDAGVVPVENPEAGEDPPPAPWEAPTTIDHTGGTTNTQGEAIFRIYDGSHGKNGITVNRDEYLRQLGFVTDDGGNITGIEGLGGGSGAVGSQLEAMGITPTGDPEADKLQLLYMNRLEQSRKEQDADREIGRERGQEIFGEGSLGRVQTEQDPEILDLIRQREELIQGLRTENPEMLAKRRAEAQFMDDEMVRLIKEKENPDSDINRALREKGTSEIQSQMQSGLRQVRGASNTANIRMNNAMVNDAIQTSIDARGGLERDINLANLSSRDQLTKDRLAGRQQNLSAEEAMIGKQREESDLLQRRLEELRAGIQEDTLRRQLINLDANSREVFGRLQTEESFVAQGVAERTGIRQELLTESNLEEARRHNLEMEEIQRIEAEKPPPESSGGGGGKSILCVAFWKLGYISDEVLKGDFEYCQEHIDDDTRRGYFWISTPLAERILTKGRGYWMTKLLAPIVSGWANEMAYRQGKDAKSSVWGKIVKTIGVPVSRFIGRVLRKIGRTEIADDQAKAILKHASHIDTGIGEDLDKWLDQERTREVS